MSQAAVAAAPVGRRPRVKKDLASMPNRIREFRLMRGMSLSELSDLAGFTRSELHKLENGVRRLRTDHLVPLSKALQCQAEELLSKDFIRQLAGPRGKFSFVTGQAANAGPAIDLPVFGSPTVAAQGSAGFDMSTVQAQVARPAQLVNVARSYACYMTGDYLPNRLPLGSLCFVNPNLAVRRGDLAVIVTNDSQATIATIDQGPDGQLWARTAADQPAISLAAPTQAHRIIGVMFA